MDWSKKGNNREMDDELFGIIMGKKKKGRERREEKM